MRKYLFFPILSSVFIIFRSGSPLAVLGGISKFVIDPFYGKFWGWPFSHIGNKVVKIIPSLANIDTASAVVMKRMVVWIFTTISHRTPNFILWCIGHSVFCECFFSNLVVKTPAASCMSVIKVCGTNYFFITTVAFTKPIISTSFSFVGDFFDNKSSVPFSSDVF